MHAIGVDHLGLFLYVANCTCGWRGPAQKYEHQAEQDKRRHQERVIRETSTGVQISSEGRGGHRSGENGQIG